MANNFLKKDIILNRVDELRSHVKILWGNAIKTKHIANNIKSYSVADRMQGIEDTCFALDVLLSKIVDGSYDFEKVADLLNRPETINDILS